MLLALCAIGLAILHGTTGGNSTNDTTMFVAVNAAFAHLPFVNAQRTLFDAELAEMVIAVGIVLAWSATHVERLKRSDVRRRVLVTLVALVPTYALSRLLQHLTHRPRPLGHVSLIPLADHDSWAAYLKFGSKLGSFPSDHAALSAVMVVLAFSLGRKFGWFYLLFGLYTDFYRIAAGLHWPSDVIGGAMIGIVAGIAALCAEPYFAASLDRAVALFDRYPARMNALAFIFLAELGHGFQGLSAIAHIGHTNFFH